MQTIQLRLARSASWRRELAGRYNDPRNLLAADQLDELAHANLHTVSADTRATITAHADSSRLREAISAAARDVEFRRRPTDFDAFLSIVVEKLSQPTLH
jgi:hypothetical protein